MEIDPVRRIKAEMELIRDFYIQSDFEGLNIPEIALFRKKITEQFWSDIESEIEFIHAGQWIPETLFEITGIAQHYGIPTRFIDWSYNLHTAIFFAADGVLSKYGQHSKEFKAIQLDKENAKQLFFVIWALDTEDLFNKSKEKINVIRPLYATNVNLTAQKGVFTLRKYINPEDDTEPFDVFINKTVQKSDKPTLYRFKIPQREAHKALVYLERMGINDKTLFPGFSGIVRYIKRKHNIL